MTFSLILNCPIFRGTYTTIITLPEKLKYDTVRGVFYFEQYINSYFINDALIAGQYYILPDSAGVNAQSYEDGYYLTGVNLLNLRAVKDTIVYDAPSLNDFGQKRFERDYEIMWQPVGVNPYCGAYYRKIYIEAVVVYLGMQSHITPILIKDCEQFEKYKRTHLTHYNVSKIPTYGFTQIINWREL